MKSNGNTHRQKLVFKTESILIDFTALILARRQRLPNGNTLITEGADGRIFEVTRDHELVWEYLSPTRIIGKILIWFIAPTEFHMSGCHKLEKPVEKEIVPLDIAVLEYQMRQALAQKR